MIMKVSQAHIGRIDIIYIKHRWWQNKENSMEAYENENRCFRASARHKIIIQSSFTILRVNMYPTKHHLAIEHLSNVDHCRWMIECVNQCSKKPYDDLALKNCVWYLGYAIRILFLCANMGMGKSWY